MFLSRGLTVRMGGALLERTLEQRVILSQVEFSCQDLLGSAGAPTRDRVLWTVGEKIPLHQVASWMMHGDEKWDVQHLAAPQWTVGGRPLGLVQGALQSFPWQTIGDEAPGAPPTTGTAMVRHMTTGGETDPRGLLEDPLAPTSPIITRWPAALDTVGVSLAPTIQPLGGLIFLDSTCSVALCLAAECRRMACFQGLLASTAFLGRLAEGFQALEIWRSARWHSWVWALLAALGMGTWEALRQEATMLVLMDTGMAQTGLADSLQALGMSLA